MLRIEKWEDVRPGDVGFIAGSGFVSDAIRHLTHRHDLQGLQTPSHAFLVLSRSEVFEALEIVKIRYIDCYKAHFAAGRVYIFRPECPADIRRAALLRLTKRYNKAAYGWGQIGGFLGVVARRKLFGCNTANLMPIGTICSELVAIYLRDIRDQLLAAGYQIQADFLEWVTRIPTNSIDPALELACCLTDRLPKTITGV